MFNGLTEFSRVTKLKYVDSKVPISRNVYSFNSLDDNNDKYWLHKVV